MKPDTIFKCIKSYNGKNPAGKSIIFEEGKNYMRTAVDMKQMGHSSKGVTYFIHDCDGPSRGNVEMSPEEFNCLIDGFLVQDENLA